MNWKRAYTFAILGMAGVFLCIQETAFSSEVYFTPTEIKGQILRSIDECKESIDIATSDITSRDILSALARAQAQGARVRIVIDKKRTLRGKGLLSDPLNSKNFAVRALARKGVMHNNFAIFDCKLLMTGSYLWEDARGKSHRHNAIFTDETKVMVKYQKEFDRLFHEGTAPDLKEAVSVAGEKAEKIEERPAIAASKGMAAGERLVASHYGVVIAETPDGYLTMNFEAFNTVFGVVSDLTEEQKEALWSRCTGKRVKWRGKVNYIGWGLVTGWMLGVTHGDTGVEVKLNPGNKPHFSNVKYGNTVTYTGKLDSRVTRMFPYKLEDGDVVKYENTLPDPTPASEFAANPYIAPVSQGPKRILLVETFDDLDALFGKGSNLTDAQKDETWKKYKGKYVSWSGQIVHKNLNVASGLRMVITQKQKGDVEVKVGQARKDKILKFQEGETVLYTGRLVERCGENAPYILEDGDIITMK